MMERRSFAETSSSTASHSSAQIIHLHPSSRSVRRPTEGHMDKANLSGAEFNALIESVYSGIRDEIPWSELIEMLRMLLQANYVSLILRHSSPDRRLLVIFSGEAQPAIAMRYDNHYHMIDPFINLPRDRAVTIDEFIGEARFLGTRYYQEFHKPLDIRYHMGADIGEDYEPICRIRVSRSHDALPFGEREKSICNLLLSHLKTAAELRLGIEMMEVEKDFYAGMLERLAVGAILLDKRGRILKSNSVAQDILNERDGLSVFQDSLVAAFSKENRVLRQLLEQSVADDHEGAAPELNGLSITRPSGRPGLGVVVHPAPQNKWLQSQYKPAALVIIRDSARKAQASGTQLRLLYGLTRAEANLAVQLMEGLALEEAAQKLCIARNTARCQLRSVFAKVGVTRQSELLRILLSGVALLG